MRGDVLLFFGILIFIFIVWVAEGGPSHPISFAGPFITPNASGIGTSTGGYSLTNGGATQTNQYQVQNKLSQAQQQVVTLEKSLASSNQFGTPSPYKGKVTLRAYVGTITADDPDKEYLSLYAGYQVPANGIDITNWRIEGEAEGYSLRIREGVNLPNSGNVNPESDIMLGSGQSAIISMGESPVGMSFHENMCTGYFDQFQNFTPYLTNSCPLPSDDFARFYYGDPQNYDACKAYVRTVSRCTLPLDPPHNMSTDCNKFVATYLNYNGCVVAHEGDRGFFGNQWRIYMNQSDSFFTHDHDTIKLLDQNGLTVDLVSY